MIVTPVALADPPLRNAVGIHEPYANRLIVELVGENGQSGFGEAAYSSTTHADLRRLRPEIAGRDAANQSALYRVVAGLLDATPETRFDPILRNFDATSAGANTAPPRTFSPIEVAALDLTGRSLGVPVAELLGGRVRDAVPFSAYLFYKHAGGGGEGDDAREDIYGEALTADDVVVQARQMIDGYGFRSIKLKAGVFPPGEEIVTIQTLRSAFGTGVPLRIDPNCAWTVETSVRVGRELANELEYFEDPTPDIAGMAAVRRGLLAEGIALPNATNMCVTAFDQIPDAVREDAVQVILGDHHYWGGLRATVELGRICSTFGIGMSMHSNSHLGVSLMAMVHLAAAIPNLTYDVDTHYPWLHEADEIITGGKIRFENGAVKVPTTPGLGVEIDRDAMARSHELFERIPYRDRDDVGYMRNTIDPTWEKLLPRW